MEGGERREEDVIWCQTGEEIEIGEETQAEERERGGGDERSRGGMRAEQ